MVEKRCRLWLERRSWRLLSSRFVAGLIVMSAAILLHPGDFSNVLVDLFFTAAFGVGLYLILTDGIRIE